MTRDEIRTALGLPDWIEVTIDLELTMERRGRGLKDWTTDARRMIAYFVERNQFGPERYPIADDLVEWLMSLATLGAGRKLVTLTVAEELLAALDLSPQLTLGLHRFRKKLKTVRSNVRLVKAAISDDETATAICIDDLFDGNPSTLGDIVDELAARGIGWFSARPSEGMSIPLNRVRRTRTGYAVVGVWSKTGLVSVDLPPRVVELSNMLADQPGGAGRHRIGVDDDHLLEKAEGQLVPRLNRSRTCMLPGRAYKHFLSEMLKRHVRKLCHRLGVPESNVPQIVARVGGKALRRGRNAAAAAAGASADEQRSTSNLLSRDLHIKYSDGMYDEESSVRTLLLDFYPKALGQGRLTC